MKIPVPRSYTDAVADIAVRKAREYGQRRGWSSVVALEPTSENGKVGIRSPYKHLLYLNAGTAPRLMKELEGRTIPIGDRIVQVRGVGQPGYVTLPGGVKVWRDQKWRHPGIKATHFLDNAVQEAIEESKPALSKGFRRVIGSMFKRGIGR